MAIGRKFIGMAERSLFAKGGRYFQMKERNAEGKAEKIKDKAEKIKAKMEKEKQKKDWKIVEDCLVLYRNAIDKTGHLPPSERAKVLEATEERIDRAVVRTYTPRAEKQSFAHQKLSEMTANLSMERKRLKK
jgi:TPP-dependent pyruvate/acetoin dehydrogenase alpha subunit